MFIVRISLPLNLGWEYSVNPTYGIYGPVVKAYHMSRRRRLVRSRELVDANSTKKQVKFLKRNINGFLNE